MREARIPLSGGDEYDALTNWRKVFDFGPRLRHRIKNKYRRRVRREAREELKKGANDAQVGSMDGWIL